MTLTEKWKKGELPDGMYYMENTSGIIGIVGHSKAFPCYNVKQIIAPVPTYEEYLESEAHCAVYSDINKWLKEENAKLKELLKECAGELQDFNNSSYPTVENILTRINAAIGKVRSDDIDSIYTGYVLRKKPRL